MKMEERMKSVVKSIALLAIIVEAGIGTSSIIITVTALIPLGIAAALEAPKEEMRMSDA